MDKLLKLDNLTDVLERFAVELEREYKQNLKNNNRIATGKLHDTAKCEVIKGEYTVVFHLQDYWRYVEGGRDKTKNNGDGSVRRNILKWLEVKKILPKPIDGKLPTPQQLSYLISRKIHKEGFKGTQDLSNATDDIWEKYREEIYTAIDKDFDVALINIFKMKPLNV
jgi:ribosomal protein S19E (S16A)